MRSPVHSLALLGFLHAAALRLANRGLTFMARWWPEPERSSSMPATEPHLSLSVPLSLGETDLTQLLHPTPTSHGAAISRPVLSTALVERRGWSNILVGSFAHSRRGFGRRCRCLVGVVGDALQAAKGTSSAEAPGIRFLRAFLPRLIRSESLLGQRGITVLLKREIFSLVT